MSIEKLMDALRIACDHIDMGALEISHCKDAELIRAALSQQPAAQDEKEAMAEKFEAMHANGDVWISTIAAAKLARASLPAQQPATPEPVKAERDQLRCAQAEAVMPLIGPLLDAWENADREVISQEPELSRQLKAINNAMEGAQPATGEPVVSRNPFASRCYTMSESHLSGHRLIVGFEKLGDAQDAHEWVARQGRGDFTHQAPSVPADVARDAEFWRYLRHHWSNAQFRFNRDERNTLKSITLTIKTAHWASDADDIERELSAAMLAAKEGGAV